MKPAILAAICLPFLVGCATIRHSTSFHNVKVENDEQPLEVVEIENSGWLAFKCIPLASGNPQKPNQLSCRWFSNTVTLQNNLNLLEQEMNAKGATRFTNLTSRNSEESFLFILLTRKAYHTSAVLLKDVDTQTPTDGQKETAK